MLDVEAVMVLFYGGLALSLEVSCKLSSLVNEKSSL